MDDQVGVRVGYGLQHVEEQSNPRLNVKLMAVAVAVDVVALNVFEDEIGLPGGRYSRVCAPPSSTTNSRPT